MPALLGLSDVLVTLERKLAALKRVGGGVRLTITGFGQIEQFLEGTHLSFID